MNDFKKLKEIIKLSDLFKWEWVSIVKSWHNSFTANCINPLHEDNIPSLQINNDKKIFKCFSCWIGWDIFNALEYLRNDIIWNKARVKYLRAKYVWAWELHNIRDEMIINKANIQYEKRFDEAMKIIAQYRRDNLKKEIKEKYLTSKTSFSYSDYSWEKEMTPYWLSSEVIYENMVWFSPNSKELFTILSERYDKEFIDELWLFDWKWMPLFKNRIVIPYVIEGNIKYFKARQTECTPKNKYETAKYKNQKIENSFLFGEDNKYYDCIFICEWEFDALAIENIWFKAISIWWLNNNKLIQRLKKSLDWWQICYICFDNENNQAWNKQARILNKKLREEGINSQIVNIPLPLDKDKIDISEYLLKSSKENFIKLLQF